MERRTVEVRVGGQSFRVVSSASEDEVRRLAGAVNEKLREVAAHGRGAGPQGLLLAAIALAHDLEEERRGREALERRTRDLMRRLLVRIDSALDEEDDVADGEASDESR